jgi:hypothetical protein
MAPASLASFGDHRIGRKGSGLGITSDHAAS